MSSSENLHPASPGLRDDTTSREAAERIAASAEPLRKKVLDLISKTPDGLAVHEIACLLKSVCCRRSAACERAAPARRD